ncbi:MAG: hypothetical protein QOE59_1071 [Actinomycetota bacterium]|nr:hypothetical protein [Actinomycetota bacterium]
MARARAAMVAAREAEHALVRAVGELAESGACEAAGHRKVARLLEELWRIDPGQAQRLVRHAEQLLPTVTLSGQPVEPRLPRVAAACADGRVGDEHLRVLLKGLDVVARIPRVTPDQLEEAQEVLVDAACQLAPSALQRVVDRLVANLDPDGAAPPEDPDPADEWLVTRRRDGTLAFTGRIHGAADVDLLLETLDVLGAPAGGDDPRTRAQRCAEGLLDLCAQAHAPHGLCDEDDPVAADDDGEDGDGPRGQDAGSRTGTDRRDHLRPVTDAEPGSDESEPAASRTGRPGGRPGAHRSPLPIPARAQIAVTIPLEWLREQVGHGRLDTGRALDPATARRLACDAGLVPAVLGTRSEPIELGRAAYVVTEALRRLLIMRDRGCAHPGCTRRARRCHAHHIIHWVDGGPTEPGNLVLLCRYHHHLVHHGGWEIRMLEGRPWFTPPRWVDPQRRPIPGGPALPDTRAA